MQVYKDIWKPFIDDKLACERGFNNCFDKFAIKVVRDGETVGHLPRGEFSKIAWYRFRLLFWCFGDDSWKITDFFPDVLADKPHP